MLERGAVEGEVFHRGPPSRRCPGTARSAPRLVVACPQGAHPPRPGRCLPGEDAFRFRHLLIRRRGLRRASEGNASRAASSASPPGSKERGAELVELDEILGYHLEQAVAVQGATLVGLTPHSPSGRASCSPLPGRRALWRADYRAARRISSCGRSSCIDGPTTTRRPARARPRNGLRRSRQSAGRGRCDHRRAVAELQRAGGRATGPERRLPRLFAAYCALAARRLETADETGSVARTERAAACSRRREDHAALGRVWHALGARCSRTSAVTSTSGRARQRQSTPRTTSSLGWRGNPDTGSVGLGHGARCPTARDRRTRRSRRSMTPCRQTTHSRGRGRAVVRSSWPCSAGSTRRGPWPSGESRVARRDSSGWDGAGSDPIFADIATCAGDHESGRTVICESCVRSSTRGSGRLGATSATYAPSTRPLALRPWPLRRGRAPRTASAASSATRTTYVDAGALASACRRLRRMPTAASVAAAAERLAREAIEIVERHRRAQLARATCSESTWPRCSSPPAARDEAADGARAGARALTSARRTWPWSRR